MMIDQWRSMMDKDLLSLGDKVYAVLADDEFEERNYSLNKVPIGREYVQKRVFNTRTKKVEIIYVKTKKVFALDTREGYRAVMLGMVSSGKTYGIRSIADRMDSSDGYSCFFVSDTKNEYYTSAEPSPTDSDEYLSGERPKGMNLTVIRPNYFKKYGARSGKNDVFFGFKISDLEESDFKEIVKFDELPPVQASLVEDLIQQIRDNPDAFSSVESIRQFIRDDNNGLSASSRATLEMKVKPLINSGFFDPPYIDIVGLLNDGSVVLNLQYYDKIDKDGRGLPAATINILRRKVVNARKEKDLKKRIFMAPDEASRFFPVGRGTLTMNDMLESVEQDRMDRVDLFFGYQTLGDIHEKIMNNSRFVFVPGVADTNIFVELYKGFGYSKVHQSQLRNTLEPVVRAMRSAKFLWMVFDRRATSPKVIRFLPPMSMHRKE